MKPAAAVVVDKIRISNKKERSWSNGEKDRKRTIRISKKRESNKKDK